MTIDELAECLALPRTTIYYWVRDLPISRKSNAEWPESARMAGARAMQKKYRLLREAAYAEGRATFDVLAQDPTFRDFVNLYIAEGYKRNRNCVSLANSDPAVVTIAIHWMRRLGSKRIACSIQYHADQDLGELRTFWGGCLGIEPNAIRLLRKSNSNQLSGTRWRSRYGVLTVTSNDTNLRARLQAWMDYLREQWLESGGVGV
jgi:hypothetical protein